jgi:hypothetical protein
MKAEKGTAESRSEEYKPPATLQIGSATLLYHLIFEAQLASSLDKVHESLRFFRTLLLARSRL